MASLRSSETESSYAKWLAKPREAGSCILCQKPATKTFTYWKITPNDFPYDRVAEVHDMAVPLRHATGPELTAEEWVELNEIKKGYIADKYVYILEATRDFRSIPAHFHLHLITLKESI